MQRWERASALIDRRVAQQCQYVQCGEDRGDGAFTSRSPGGEAEAPRASGTVPHRGKALSAKADVSASNDGCDLRCFTRAGARNGDTPAGPGR